MGTTTKRIRLRATRLSIGLAVLIVIAACTGGESDHPRAAKGPNFLVIMTDDQRASGTMAVMPAARRWFREGGTELTNAFATTPVCCPSRASIFTGRYAHNHGIIRNGPEFLPNLDHRSTLQRYLQEAGYRTGILGKYLNDWDVEQDPSYFDEWAIFPGDKIFGYYGGLWNINGAVEKVSEYSTDVLGQHALDFIDSAADDGRPWILFLHPYAPHAPYAAEPRYQDAPVPQWRRTPALRDRDPAGRPEFLQQDFLTFSVAEGRAIRRAQLRTLMSVDDLIDQVMTRLSETGQDEQTLSFFMSDNGYLWGEHGIAKKYSAYTDSTKIPMFMRWRDQVDRGARDNRLVANIDIAPTILAAAGISPDPTYPIDGRSLLDSSGHDRLVVEYLRPPGERKLSWIGTRTRGYHYVEYYGPEDDLVFREYYDLRSDPWQVRNLLTDGDPSNDPDVARLSQTLQDDRACVGSDCP